MERVAIIDMGSNSIRFIVIQVADNKSYRLEYQQKEAIRLGRGMSETGKANPEWCGTAPWPGLQAPTST